MTITAATAVVIDPKTPTRIFVANPDGVFRSDDAAETWAPIHSGLPEGPVVALAQHPLALDRLFAATDDGRLFRSDDAGASWRARR